MLGPFFKFWALNSNAIFLESATLIIQFDFLFQVNVAFFLFKFVGCRKGRIKKSEAMGYLKSINQKFSIFIFSCILHTGINYIHFFSNSRGL